MYQLTAEKVLVYGKCKERSRAYGTKSSRKGATCGGHTLERQHRELAVAQYR